MLQVGPNQFSSKGLYIPNSGIYRKNGNKFTSIHLELTNICGYKCIFCPRDEFTRPFGIMSMDDLGLAMDRIGDFDGIVRLHGYGDPLVLSDLPEKIAFIRKSWIDCGITFITTLGYEVSEEFLESIISRGLNKLIVSFYGSNPQRYQEIHGSDKFKVARKNLLFVADLARKYQQSFSVLVLTENFDMDCESAQEKEEFIAFLNSHNIPHVPQQLTNRGDSSLVYYKVNTLLPCSVAWGSYASRLEVTWNLNVVPCCSIWNDNIVLGNLREQTIEEIFIGKKYTDFIEAILSNNLDAYPVCRDCERDLQGSQNEIENIITKCEPDITKSFVEKNNKVLVYHGLDQHAMKRIFCNRKVYKEVISLDSMPIAGSFKKTVATWNIDTVLLITPSTRKQNKIIQYIKEQSDTVKIVNIFGTSKASDVAVKIRI